MPSLRARIKTLEDARTDTSVHLVVVELGESEETTLMRHDLQADARVIFITPLDALL